MSEIYLDKFCSKKTITDTPEWRYFKKLGNNAMAKSNKRITNIINRIDNDISLRRYPKYYQIQNFIEYKILFKYINENHCEYELLWSYSSDSEMNKLNKIIRGDYYCCRDCDYPVKFVNVKIPCLYCYLCKK